MAGYARECGEVFTLRKRVSTVLLVLVIAFAVQGHSAGAHAMIDPPAPELTSAASQSDGENIELLGHLGGAAQAIVVRGEYTYVGLGPELAILDVSDPASIQRLGGLVAEGDVVDISLRGDNAYVAYQGDEVTGLQVIDIRHATLPVSRVVLEMGCRTPSIAIEDTAAYFAYTACGPMWQNAGTYLYRLDISEPSHPTIDSSNDQFMSSYLAAEPRDGWLYTLWEGPSPEGYYGMYLKVFDVSDPSEMVEISTTQVASGSSALALSGDHAFLAAGENGVQVVSISDPFNPSPLITHTLPGAAQEIFIDGDIAYLAAGDAGLQMVDISDPLNPSDAGSYAAEGSSADVYISGDDAYLANGWSGVEIARLSDLTQSGSYRLPPVTHDIVVAEPYAYSATDNGFWVLDTSEASSPRVVAHLPTPTPAVSIALSGIHAYVACPGNGIHIIDVTSPLAPVGAVFYPLAEELHQVEVVGNLLYVAAGSGGLRILDIGDPLNPAETGAFPLAEGVNAVAVDGDEAYLAAGHGDLRVVDVSDPADPHEIGAYTPPEQLTGPSGSAVAVQDGVAYLATVAGPPTPLAHYMTGNVWQIDVSDPDDPDLISTIYQNYGWAPYSLKLEADRLYVVFQRQGLHLYDTSDPTALQELGSYDPAEYTVGVSLAGGVIYLFNRSTYLLRYADPALPTISGRITHANRLPFAGARVSAGSTAFDQVTDAQGMFTYRALADGSYSLVPSLPGYAFSPPSRTVSVPPSASGQNFTILPEPVEIDFLPGTSATLSYTDTQGLPTWLDIPADASSSPLTLHVFPAAADGSADYAFAGHAFELAADPGSALSPDFTFDSPLTVTIQYSADDTAVISGRHSLSLWWWDGSTWQDAAQSCSPETAYSRDPDNYTLSLPICQTGIFKLMGPTNRVLLPVILFN